MWISRAESIGRGVLPCGLAPGFSCFISLETIRVVRTGKHMLGTDLAFADSEVLIHLNGLAPRTTLNDPLATVVIRKLTNGGLSALVIDYPD